MRLGSGAARLRWPQGSARDVWPPGNRVLGHLTWGTAMTDNYRGQLGGDHPGGAAGRRATGARPAARRGRGALARRVARLVLAADADRRAIERDLHDGVHQRLVALAVSLQLARRGGGADPAARCPPSRTSIVTCSEALDETARLAQRIHPPTLEAGDLGRCSARPRRAQASLPRSTCPPAASYPPEVVMTIHLCWLDALARAGGEARVTIDVHDRADALTFEIDGRRRPVGCGSRATARPCRGARRHVRRSRRRAGGGSRVSGSLPLAR